MSSPHLADPQKLVEPLPGAAPTGINLRSDMVFSEINKARTWQPSTIAGEPDREPDWNDVVTLTARSLAERSKDLRLAAWLIEGLVKLDGFSGFRDGLWVMRELAVRYWDQGLHPFDDESPEETNELRAGPFANLMQVDRGMVLPGKIRDIPLFGMIGEQGLSCSYLKSLVPPARRQEEPEEDHRVRCETVEQQKRDYEAARQALPTPKLEELQANIDGTLAELKAIDEVFSQKLGKLSTSVAPLKQAIDECRKLVSDTLATRAPAGGEAAAGGEAGQEGGGAAAGPNPIKSRRQAYRWLAHIAAYLREHDPHSPVPDRVDRAAAYGRMSFFELRSQLMRDAETGGFEPLDAPPPPDDDEPPHEESSFDEPVPAETPAPAEELAASDAAASETAGEESSATDAPVEPSAEAPPPEPPADVAPVAASPAQSNGQADANKLPKIGSRGEAYHRLSQVADYLARTEPNSPVPNMVRTAVAWGSMPFDKLMETLYPDAATRDKIGTLVGVKPGGDAPPT